MDCNCNENMSFACRTEDYSWNEDTYNLSVSDVYECDKCGSQTSLDVTAEFLCENPL